jgi:triacylglycerol lipase
MKIIIQNEQFDFYIKQPGQGFDLQNSLSFAILSHLVYESDEVIRQTSSLLGFEEYKFHSFKGHRYDTEFFAAVNEEHIAIAIRGTEVSEKSDIATDAKIDMKMFAWDDGHFDGKIHHGFYDAVTPALPVLREAVAALVDTYHAEHVWITGHSLGAALAVLASAFLSSQDIPIAGVYTYGSPRVGDDVFGKSFKSSGLWDKTYRVVNCNDIVTMVPPPRPYHHVGIPVKIDTNGEVQVGESFWPHFRETTEQKLKVGIRDLLNSRSLSSISSKSMISDHSLLKNDGTGYIQQLQKALNELSGIC